MPYPRGSHRLSGGRNYRRVVATLQNDATGTGSGSSGGAAPPSGNTAYAAAVLADSPISYWKMIEASGPAVTDYGSALLNGTATNSPTFGVTGPLTGLTAVSFLRASSQYVARADNAAYDVGNTFTLEAWVKRANAATDQGVLTLGSGSAYIRIAGTTNRLQLIQSQTALICTSSSAIGNDLWTHVAATKSGATSKLYINGVDVSGAVTDATCVNPSKALGVGCDVDVSTTAVEFFQGSIGHAAVYGTALSAARIAAHFAAAS